MKSICLCLLVIVLAGCQTIFGSAEKLDDATRDYQRMVRWQEMERAVLTYVDTEARELYSKRIVAAKEVNIVDYRIVSVDCNEKKGEADVRVSIEYFRLPSATVRTVEDLQKWRYVGDNKGGGWRLTTPLPLFP